MFKNIHLFLFVLSMTQLGAAPISYNRDVRPILSQNCFFCHGFDKEKREADLRLDTFEGATAEGAIVPGDPNQSELIARIFSKDADDQMPPSDSAYSLTKAQKEILVQWIKEGAEYQEHWAYQKLARPASPDPKSSAIDAFLKRTWKKNNVDPVQKADPWNLLRRLSYDLRGLPPTMEEVASFSKDPSAGHYRSFQEEWLGSTEYAEHQGLLWLDLVRYADSNGMVSDEPIIAGPYRKYVIESFRDNMPFDQFTREQIAGDLLPNRSDRSLTASGYNRLVKTNCEAGVIEKEALYQLKGEHVRALGTVWLGTTTGCAECHDHKYDPITAKDYYSLAAFFDPLIEAGVYEPGDRRVPLHYIHDTKEDSKKEHALMGRIDELRETLYTSTIDPAQRDAWSKEILKNEEEAKKVKGPTDWLWFPAQLGAAHIIQGDYSQTEAGREVDAPTGTITRHFSGETMIAPVTGSNEAYFTHLTIDPEKKPEFIALQIVNGAYRRVGWHKAYHLTYYWGPKDHALLEESQPWLDPKKMTHMGPLPEAGKLVRLEIPKAKFLKASYVPQVMAWMQAGGKVTWGDSGYRTSAHQLFKNEHAASAYRYFWERPFNRDDRNDFHSLLLTSLKKKPADRREIHSQLIDIAFREAKQPQLTAELTELYRQVYLHRQSAIPTLVSKETEAKKTHVLTRGNFMDESGPQALPAIPEVFGKLDKPNPTRLDLANWLVAKENPLTARVFVNRLWHQFYGRGISETLEDSGNQGDWPSHIELLDWLAAEFIESAWDVQHMIRLLTSAEAYQLSSVPGSLLEQNDPTNRLHARQGRSRHSAEEIRDSALLAAGLLHKTKSIPTASFFPYQPDSYWAKSNKVMYGSRYQIWETTQGASQYQRSLYTFWKRQNIHPSMLALDAPTRQECSARRTITNTPAQALALLNDPQFVEAARLLAARALQADGDPIDNLFNFVLQRAPDTTEKKALKELVEKMTTRFTENPEEATQLLKIGQDPTRLDDTIQHATWTATARIILNLHEFLTRS